MKAYWGMEVLLHAFLTSAVDVGEWSTSRPGRFTPRERSIQLLFDAFLVVFNEVQGERCLILWFVTLLFLLQL
jgi:hypothetical protein